MVAIRDELSSDTIAREALLDRALGDARFDKPSERLREGRLPARGLALAATHEGDLIGSVRLWNIRAGSAGAGLLLGPLAVDADYRSLGIGACLMREALRRAAGSGHRFVLLVGDAPYYARFGFAPAPADLLMPGPTDPARFLALDLVPGTLTDASGPVAATGAPILTRRGSERDRRQHELIAA